MKETVQGGILASASSIRTKDRPNVEKSALIVKGGLVFIEVTASTDKERMMKMALTDLY
jgi:hypothetical protein